MGAACSSSPHPVEPSISGSTTSSKTPGSNPDPTTTRTDPQIPMTPPSSSSSSSTKTTNTNIHTIDQPALTIFSGTFNINAAQLNQSDAKLWLTDNKAQIATIVCLAFQECGSAPNEITPVPKNAIESPRPPESPSHVYTPKEYCRQNLKPAEAEANNEFLAVLKGALPSHKLVADLALGESPTGGKIEINGKETEWYGYVRLVVFYKGAEQLECQSVISPVGGKDSSFGQKNQYRENNSPDKGAVGLYITNFNLTLMSLHLYGTNKYNTLENKFDVMRRKQLKTINDTFALSIGPQFAKSIKIIMGDFNFRCEALGVTVEDKDRGGKDFETISAMVKEGKKNQMKMRELYRKHDRLRLWMDWFKKNGSKPDASASEEFGSPSDYPHFFTSCEDVFASENISLVSPTFTYSVGDKEPRSYNEKRTPSWTDRVLYSQNEFVLNAVGKSSSVVCSDHEPVFALFTRRSNSIKDRDRRQSRLEFYQDDKQIWISPNASNLERSKREVSAKERMDREAKNRELVQARARERSTRG